LSSVTAWRLTSLHKPLLGHRKEFYRLKEVIFPEAINHVS